MHKDAYQRTFALVLRQFRGLPFYPVLEHRRAVRKHPNSWGCHTHRKELSYSLFWIQDETEEAAGTLQRYCRHAIAKRRPHQLRDTTFLWAEGTSRHGSPQHLTYPLCAEILKDPSSMQRSPGKNDSCLLHDDLYSDFFDLSGRRFFQNKLTRPLCETYFRLTPSAVQISLKQSLTPFYVRYCAYDATLLLEKRLWNSISILYSPRQGGKSRIQPSKCSGT